ncbi:hypothetical protein CEXT_289361 [Caerostris extrusa]|uniref:Uncharacterized protein n=1 Tax=Caerostris extrusa TaxID=172846 RepID=A0AAV4RN54_CAEEX|nr:hypothetical protein CEXT_289361 [Caerostris extrusa]
MHVFLVESVDFLAGTWYSQSSEIAFPIKMSSGLVTCIATHRVISEINKTLFRPECLFIAQDVQLCLPNAWLFWGRFVDVLAGAWCAESSEIAFPITSALVEATRRGVKSFLDK